MQLTISDLMNSNIPKDLLEQYVSLESDISRAELRFRQRKMYNPLYRLVLNKKFKIIITSLLYMIIKFFLQKYYTTPIVLDIGIVVISYYTVEFTSTIISRILSKEVKKRRRILKEFVETKINPELNKREV